MTQNYDAISGASVGEGRGVNAANAAAFPDPYADISSYYMPTSIKDAFDLTENLVMTMPPFRAVIQRVVRYFLTALEVHGASDVNRQKYEDFFNDDLHILQQLGEIGEDVAIYGNAFVSVYLPFKRMLTCPDCGLCRCAEEMEYQFDPKNMVFKGTCAKCGHEVEFKRDDRRSTDQTKIKLIRWNPKRMDLRVHPVSGKTEYFYRLDERLVAHITSGQKIDQFYINESSWEFIEAACVNQTGTERKFQFKDNSLYHFKMTTPAGVEMRGWGMPPLLALYKIAYYAQMMRRYDEAIAMDYIIPFRVLYPQGSPNSDGQDPLTLSSMRSFVAAMQQMVARKRKNITDVQIAPYPIGYQMLGGEGKNLTPNDVMKTVQNDILNALGYPVDLYQGTLQLQAAPVALRVFERHWQFLVDGFNDLINWTMRIISRHLGWDKITGKLASVTLADDVERKALLLQSAAGQDISKTTAYKVFGIDFIKEQKRIAQEQMEMQAIQQRAMAASQATQMNAGYDAPQDAGAADEEGMPATAAGTPVGATPGDIWSQAGDIAKKLVLNTPPSQVRGQLLRIKQTNPTLHSMVKQQMDDFRSQLRSQGQEMAIQAAQQGGMA
jgi:hypothetical protein